MIPPPAKLERIIPGRQGNQEALHRRRVQSYEAQEFGVAKQKSTVKLADGGFRLIFDIWFLKK